MDRTVIQYYFLLLHVLSRLKVPWSTSFLCLADSAHSASRFYQDMKTQQVRAYDELPLEIRLIVLMVVTSVLWYLIPRRLCITEVYS